MSKYEITYKETEPLGNRMMYNGQIYTFTGKCGHNTATKQAGREYALRVGKTVYRIWAFVDGSIVRD